MAARSLALLVPFVVFLTACNTWESRPVDGGNLNKSDATVGDGGIDSAIDADANEIDAGDASTDAVESDTADAAQGDASGID
jgi:hypothetical protein